EAQGPADIAGAFEEAVDDAIDDDLVAHQVDERVGAFGQDEIDGVAFAQLEIAERVVGIRTADGRGGDFADPGTRVFIGNARSQRGFGAPVGNDVVAGRAGRHAGHRHQHHHGRLELRLGFRLRLRLRLRFWFWFWQAEDHTHRAAFTAGQVHVDATDVG